MLNQKIREYEIISQIGAGDYGVVYRAHDTSVDRDVAIKVILPKYASDTDFKNRRVYPEIDGHLWSDIQRHRFYLGIHSWQHSDSGN